MSDDPGPLITIVLSRAYRSVADFLESGLVMHGIPSDDFWIVEVLLHKGPLAISAIAQKAPVTNAVAKKTVKRLKHRGLVKSDGEMFELTDDGRKLVAGIYEQHKKDIEAVLGRLSVGQRRQLHEMLKKIGLEADRLQRERSKNKKAGLAPWQLRRATEYISEHLAHPARMKEIAELTGLSESQFGRAFKLSMGISPHKWLIGMRISEAQELLKEGKLSLAEIAIVTGFAEQSHFTRVFKEIVGVSPGIWQRQNRA